MRKYDIYVVLKTVITAIICMFVGKWAADGIDPIAIVFRATFVLVALSLTSLILSWFEEGIDLKKKLE